MTTDFLRVWLTHSIIHAPQLKSNWLAFCLVIAHWRSRKYLVRSSNPISKSPKHVWSANEQRQTLSRHDKIFISDRHTIQLWNLVFLGLSCAVFPHLMKYTTHDHTEVIKPGSSNHFTSFERTHTQRNGQQKHLCVYVQRKKNTGGGRATRSSFASRTIAAQYPVQPTSAI